MTLCYFIWEGIAPYFYDWYFTSEKTIWLRDLYSSLDGRLSVTIPITLIIFYLAFIEIRKRLADEDIRPWRLGFVAILVIIINVRDDAQYPRVFGEIRFDNVFNDLLLFYFVTSCYASANSIYDKIIGKILKPKQVSINVGFTVDEEQEDRLPENVKKYGETIVDQLMATIKNNKNSIALGITGEWGSGKTTFLNLLKKNLKDRTEIVNFNPWMCQTPEQVTRDFFSSLRHQLSHNHSSLAKPISHYARHLDKVRVSLLGGVWLEGSNFTKSPSLFALKSQLSSKFKSLVKPVIVIIDDLDRLESKEVFEVLRLIRNTGDIHNTIYIAAFDKEYVTSVLDESGCNEPASYLEKIFPIEIHLPKPEPHQIWDVFKENLMLQDKTGRNFAKTLTGSLSNSDLEIILKILTNYRKAKRFSRLLSLNVNFVAKYYLKDFKYLDLFWIELLQFYDKRTYDNLANDATVILYYDSVSKRYHLRQGIVGEITSSKNASHEYKGEKSWQPLSPYILKILFGDYIKTTSLSISYPENYMKFFTIGLSSQKLSANELNNLTDGKHDYKQVVDEWIAQGKYTSSIEYNLRQIKVESLSDSGLTSYLNGVMYYGLKKQSWQNKSLGFMNDILSIRNFINEKQAHDIVLKWLEDQMKNPINLLPLSRILKSLYAIKEYEEEGSNTYTFNEKIISNVEIESLLGKTVKNYLNASENNVNPTDILKKGTELFRLFDNCCVAKQQTQMEGYTNYVQTGFDVLIKFFSARKSKPKVVEYERGISRLYKEDEPDPDSFDDPNDYYQWQEYEEERYYNMMSSHFGNGYEKKLEKFKSKCFQVAAVETPTSQAEKSKMKKTKPQNRTSRSKNKNREKIEYFKFAT